MVGATVRLKLEGANPTGSFKDRGMTCAVSAAVRDGAKAVICASTGNTAASAAAYAARAGITCAVIVPEGKIAQGKMAQTLVHGARVISLKGNFDQALTLVRELTDTHPIVLVNSVNEFRIEGQKTAAFEIHEGLDRRPRSAVHPGRQRRQHHLLLARLSRAGRGAEAVRLPGRGRRAAGARAPVIEHPETVASAIRIGNPVRWEDAMAAATDSRGAIRVGQRRGDPRRLPAARLPRRDVLRARLRGVGRGLLKYGADGAEQIACVLTGRGLKDPETAIANNDGRMITCAAETAAIEEAVLGDP